jgi:F-type H+-transporting ATPase subunit a
MIHFNWTQLIPEVGHHYIHVATLVITGAVLITLAIAGRLALGGPQERVIPASRFGLKGLFEAMTEFVASMAEEVIGEEGRKYVPMFGALFMTVFIGNLFGLLPGWTPATDNMNTTLAMGLFMFVVYNALGIKEHGLAYIKQFWGPFALLGPLMIVVETISHLVRPFSLGLRLYANMMADHILVGVFYGLFKYLLPLPIMALGLFVCFMQAFVFMLLGMIYISMAISHDH